MMVMRFGRSMVNLQHREILQAMSKPERPLHSKYLGLFEECLMSEVSGLA